MKARIENYFLELSVNSEGTVLNRVAGQFAQELFPQASSVYQACPYLIGTLEALPEQEALLMEGMVLEKAGKEYNIDLELYRSGEQITVLIHDRSRLYQNLSQLNQNRNDLYFLKKELDAKNLELERLRQKADKANEEKSRFLAMMSHEVRNPLNVILGYTEMLAPELSSEKAKDYLKYLKASGRNLKVIVEDILDLSRVEAGKLVLSNEPISLADLMDELEQNYRGSHRDLDIALHFSTAENLPKQVLGDDVRLHQILTNLINNSIKFTPHGSVSTSVNLQSSEGEGAKVCFQVKDTGRGMTAEQAASVFEEYQQNELDDNRIHKGAGLGLAIVKRLVTAMNGAIAVESQEGKGTTFSIDIPFHIAPASLAKEKVLKVPNRNYIKGSRILVADDNYMNRSIVAHILKKEEANFQLVKDGLEALSAMQSEPFDLVLLDINMPNLSGEALIQQREAYKAENANTTFVALTGNSSQEDIKGYKEIGFADVIPKPFTSEGFKQALNLNLAEQA